MLKDGWGAGRSGILTDSKEYDRGYGYDRLQFNPV